VSIQQQRGGGLDERTCALNFPPRQLAIVDEVLFITPLAVRAAPRTFEVVTTASGPEKRAARLSGRNVVAHTEQ
jgi:hypothetical protein